ncbi:hypothetical protein P4597_07720 [Peribacillus simplex]|uniref:hypothetical protein n=1 Tax=Peribacillus simplex TaxID=1478 RepID=UPI002E210EE8|nr:hypothetical protein [Peribacillus simplex]
MDNKENLQKLMIEELKMIQDIIKRMTTNSFLIKGWALTLIVTTLILKGNNQQIILAFIPLLVFWFLDAYYLWQEKLYRELYTWVVNNRAETEDFLFNLDGYRFKKQVQSKWKIMLSVTLIMFYGLIGLLVIIYSCYLLLSQKFYV